jgi:16S rRNA (guanine527-N7)-methyltransferase
VVSYETFCRHWDVSRETHLKLSLYEKKVIEWNKVHNLMRVDEDFWFRHILDSLQVLAHLPQGPMRLLDLGTGAGCPGFIVALASPRRVTLSELSTKKIAFLRHVSRETSVPCEILQGDFSKNSQQYDVVLSRAVTSLKELLAMGAHLVNNSGFFLLHKGKTFELEIKEAQTAFSFEVQPFPSITNPESVLLKVYNVSRETF